MNLALFIARRYLISKKSHNIINIISAISMTGIMVGTMALIVVLSVFNGFEMLVKSLFSSFDPDLKITLAEGKSFNPELIDTEYIKSIDGVLRVTEIIEETALLKYRNRQVLVTLKGVSDDFEMYSGLDTMTVYGQFQLHNGEANSMVLGYGVAYTLDANLNDYLEPIAVFAPRRTGSFSALPDQAFNNLSIFPSGIFSIQQDIDTRYALVPLRFARELFEYEKDVTSIEIGLKKGANISSVKRQIQQLAGDLFQVKDRYEQQEMLYKIMKSEKLAIFLILTFILLVATFNMIGTLTMLIIDKKKDIAVLGSLGATKSLTQKIFFTEGIIISLAGAIAGMILGAIICWIQMRFGIVPLQAGGGSFVIDSYPVDMQIRDFLTVFMVILLIAIPSSWYPTSKITSAVYHQRLA